jgi:hypothetical protein
LLGAFNRESARIGELRIEDVLDNDGADGEYSGLGLEALEVLVEETFST